MAVFCLATYGEGDPTDNAMEFIDWLKNGDPDLNGLNYAVSTIFHTLFYFVLYFIFIKNWRIYKKIVEQYAIVDLIVILKFL